MVMTRLRELAGELAAKAGTPQSTELWRSAHTLLKKTTADPMKVGRVIAERNVASLVAMLDSGIGEQHRVPGGARSMTAPPPPVHSANVSAAVEAALGGPATLAPRTPQVAQPVTDAELVSALKAFKRRLKMTQLDSDSKLTNRALTGGSHTVTAITPPNTFSTAVWEKLAQQGKIKRSGQGLYALVPDKR